jgi:hypothetical protein
MFSVGLRNAAVCHFGNLMVKNVEIKIKIKYLWK